MPSLYMFMLSLSLILKNDKQNRENYDIIWEENQPGYFHKAASCYRGMINLAQDTDACFEV